jgi:polysaccharide deacetylase 2 family uncharacterized protein YibQ
VAHCAHAAEKEILLHLPLEPYHDEKQYPSGYIINTGMSQATVAAQLDKNFKAVPHARGVNNHMGSKATEDERLMGIIFDRLQEKDLFFLDSRVTSKSVCPRLAARKKLPFAERDVFLDNVNERKSIERQFMELADIAQKQGFAIGIGHDRELTWQIVNEQILQLQTRGFEIVSVHDIIDSF